MNNTALGASTLEVSPICLGGFPFGRDGCSEAQAHLLLGHALDNGVNFIDTADSYGPAGLNERIIGNWLYTSGQREQVVIATKFGFGVRHRAGSARQHITDDCNASLRRLRTDYIDLYQAHIQHVETPEEETLGALDDLVREGKVRHIGCSNYAAYRVLRGLWLSDTQGLARWCALQAQYNLLERSVEREHVPTCLEHQVSLIPWSPLAGGFLTGKYRRDDLSPAGARLDLSVRPDWRLNNERAWSILNALTTVAVELNVEPAQVAIAWLLHKPAVASVAVGATSAKQLDENIRAASLTLSETATATLDDASAFDPGYPYRMLERMQGRW